MSKIKLELTKPVVLYPQLSISLGGVGEALFFQQLYYWRDRGTRKDGWIYKTKAEIEEETTLSIKQQDRIRKKLEAMGILQTKLIRVNGSPTLHYKLDIEKVQKIISQYTQREHSNIPKGNIPIYPKGTFQCTQRADSNMPKGQILYITENTTENTTESTTPSCPVGQTRAIPTKKEKSIDDDWSFVQQVEQLKQDYHDNNKNRNKAMIAYYMHDRKKMDFRSKELYIKEFKRNLASAKHLMNYTDDEIIKTMNYCQEEYKEKWTLETVVKKIPQVIKKNNNIW